MLAKIAAKKLISLLEYNTEKTAHLFQNQSKLELLQFVLGHQNSDVSHNF